MNIGIDLGGSHIAVGLVSTDGKIIDKLEKDIIKKDSIQDIEDLIVSTIINFIKELLKEYNIEINNIKKIGIATPGEPKDGYIKNVVNLGIKSFPIVNILKENLQYSNISIRNDAKCAAIAEKTYGSLKNVEDAIFLCIGTGIGGAAFINGEMLIPKRYSGFEFGHMVIKKDGKLCKCGNKGCFASMKALKLDISKELGIDYKDSRKIVESLKENQNNKQIIAILEEYLNDLILGLTNITNILEPEAISLGGGFIYYKDILWNKLNNKFSNNKLFFNKGDIPTLKLATFGNNAGIIGSSIDKIWKRLYNIPSELP